LFLGSDALEFVDRKLGSIKIEPASLRHALAVDKLPDVTALFVESDKGPYQSQSGAIGLNDLSADLLQAALRWRLTR
jgi:hypothetical protein